MYIRSHFGSSPSDVCQPCPCCRSHLALYALHTFCHCDVLPLLACCLLRGPRRDPPHYFFSSVLPSKAVKTEEGASPRIRDGSATPVATSCTTRPAFSKEHFPKVADSIAFMDGVKAVIDKSFGESLRERLL